MLWQLDNGLNPGMDWISNHVVLKYVKFYCDKNMIIMSFPGTATFVNGALKA